MIDSALFRLAAIGALYAFYLVAYFIFGEDLFGPATYYWQEAAVVASTTVVLTWTARWISWPPFRRFLLFNAGAHLFLLATSLSYGQPLHVGPVDLATCFYPFFLCGWIFSWGYLVLHLAKRNPPSRQTIVLFLILMIGMVILFAGFYAPIYSGTLGEFTGRLYVSVAALELGAVIVGLAALLLGVPAALVIQVFGVTLLAASDMLYSEMAALYSLTPSSGGFAGVEPIWMGGLVLVLAGSVVMPHDYGAAPGASGDEPAIETARSGLSTVLLALSLGAVLLSAVVMQALDFLFHDQEEPSGEPFFIVLFVVLLVVVMVWITNRFDEAVKFVRNHSLALFSNRLTGEPWRRDAWQLAWILDSTGLASSLDALHKAATRLRPDVLFLGPERLNPPAAEPVEGDKPSAFIMMPFSLEDSDEVHQILRRVCTTAGVRPVRGDDLFTPTDILDDIWRALTAAHFVIADITGRNPNVLYELGMAHTLAKPVLILSRNADDIPIDLATRRVILYGAGGDDAWRKELETKAAAAVKAMLEAYGDGEADPPGRDSP